MDQEQQGKNGLLGCGVVLILVGIGMIATDAMGWGIGALVLSVIAIAMAFANPQKKDEGQAEGYVRAKPKVTVTVSRDKGMEYPIKGINLSGINDSHLGDFIGYVRALKSNPYDPYAIGVYCGSKRLGYLPRDNKELHRLITERGGSMDAEGYVAKAEDEDGHTFYYGKVSIIGL